MNRRHASIRCVRPPALRGDSTWAHFGSNSSVVRPSTVATLHRGARGSGGRPRPKRYPSSEHGFPLSVLLQKNRTAPTPTSRKGVGNASWCGEPEGALARSLVPRTNGAAIHEDSGRTGCGGAGGVRGLERRRPPPPSRLLRL